MYNFEKLKVWQESIELAKIIYQKINEFPKEERYALVDQLKRAVTSISLNIAEGSGSKSKKVFASYLENSKGSLYETITVLKLAEKLFELNCGKELNQCAIVSKLLHGLLKSIRPQN